MKKTLEILSYIQILELIISIIASFIVFVNSIKSHLPILSILFYLFLILLALFFEISTLCLTITVIKNNESIEKLEGKFPSKKKTATKNEKQKNDKSFEKVIITEDGSQVLLCENCGYQLFEDDKACPNCGKEKK